MTGKIGLAELNQIGDVLECCAQVLDTALDSEDIPSLEAAARIVGRDLRRLKTGGELRTIRDLLTVQAEREKKGQVGDAPERRP